MYDLRSFRFGKLRKQNQPSSSNCEKASSKIRGIFFGGLSFQAKPADA
jgi:hypothetical protein